jgi:methionine synthase / methylenetetrahydrofolate reductase(NADPH)
MELPKTFREVLQQKIPLLFDGATGTELYNRGIFINRCFEDANLSSPSIITELHRDYLKAGAEVLSTNSWGANRFKLAKHNLQDQTAIINLAAAKLAKDVAGKDAFVAGSVGPLGVRIEPWGPTSFDEARAAFAEQIRGLKDGGAEPSLLLMKSHPNFRLSPRLPSIPKANCQSVRLQNGPLKKCSNGAWTQLASTALLVLNRS